jgi:hypothetical protein
MVDATLSATRNIDKRTRIVLIAYNRKLGNSGVGVRLRGLRLGPPYV